MTANSDFCKTHKRWRQGCHCIECMPLHHEWIYMQDSNGNLAAHWLKDEGNGCYGVYKNKRVNYGIINVKVGTVTEAKARALVLTTKEMHKASAK